MEVTAPGRGRRGRGLAIGIGVNVNIPEEELLATLEARSWSDGANPAAVEELSLTLNREVTLISSCGEKITGIAVDLAPDGALLIRSSDGRLRRVIEGHIISYPGLDKISG